MRVPRKQVPGVLTAVHFVRLCRRSLPKCHEQSDGADVCDHFSFHKNLLIQYFGDYAGNETEISKERPSRLDALISPLWAVTTAFTMDNPMPCPPVREFLDGSAR